MAHVAGERRLRHAARDAGAGEGAGRGAQDRAEPRAGPQVRRSAFSRGAVRFRLLQTADWKLVTRASVTTASTASSAASSLLDTHQTRNMKCHCFPPIGSTWTLLSIELYCVVGQRDI